jgi:hypothetical protein
MRHHHATFIVVGALALHAGVIGGTGGRRHAAGYWIRPASTAGERSVKRVWNYDQLACDQRPDQDALGPVLLQRAQRPGVAGGSEAPDTDQGRSAAAAAAGR